MKREWFFIAGTLAITLGMAWGRKGFGPLQPLELLRATSLSTLLLVLGGILLYTSLVLGFLELPTRERRNRQK